MDKIQMKERQRHIKPGFHYRSWRPELTARVDGWPVSITCQHGPSTRLVETRARQHGPCWRVMENGHPSTRAVNSGSGNRALVSNSKTLKSYETAESTAVYTVPIFDWERVRRLSLLLVSWSTSGRSRDGVTWPLIGRGWLEVSSGSSEALQVSSFPTLWRHSRLPADADAALSSHSFPFQH